MIHTLHGIAGVNPRVGIRFSFNDHLDNPTFSHLSRARTTYSLGLDRPSTIFTITVSRIPSQPVAGIFDQQPQAEHSIIS